MAFGRVELFTVTVVLSEPAPGTGWHYLTVIHWWCFGGLWKAAWVSASPLL